MRFEKGHKAETRRRILDVASKQFRRNGVSAAGIAGIMGEAGLTNGAFYPHFPSKAELVREAVAGALEEQQRRVEQKLNDGQSLEDVIRGYLSLEHVKNCDSGCPSAALLPEIGREPKATRQAYEKGLESYLSALAAATPQQDAAVARRRAAAIFALMAGTLQYARAATGAAAAKRILEGGIEAALLLARAPAE